VGLLAVVGGLLLALGPRLAPELAWIARSLHKLGIDSGAVVGTGVLSILLAWLSYQVRGVGAQMRTAEEALHCTQAFSLGMRQMVDRMTRQQVELGELREGQKALLRLNQEQAGAQTAGMQVDATYSLAASTDQLGRRLEDRLRSQESTFESRFLDVLGSLAATQAQLSGLLEAGDFSRVTDDLLDGPPSEMRLNLDAAPCLPCAEQDGDEFEVYVELEEEPDEDEGEVCDVRSFDWNAVVLPEKLVEEGLGLLDELDEDGAPVESPVAAEEVASLDSVPSLAREEGAEYGAGLFSEQALEEAWQAFRRRKESSES
jgi:hypothetical protein